MEIKEASDYAKKTVEAKKLVGKLSSHDEMIVLLFEEVERHNDKSLKNSEFLTITFGDDREYNVKITPKDTIISIHRVK